MRNWRNYKEHPEVNKKSIEKFKSHMTVRNIVDAFQYKTTLVFQYHPQYTYHDMDTSMVFQYIIKALILPNYRHPWTAKTPLPFILKSAHSYWPNRFEKYVRKNGSGAKWSIFKLAVFISLRTSFTTNNWSRCLSNALQLGHFACFLKPVEGVRSIKGPL